MLLPREDRIRPRERPVGAPQPLAIRRLAVSGAAGIVAVAIVMAVGGWQFAPVAGWDVAATVFIVWIWMVIWPLSPQETAAHATIEDPNRAISDTVTLSASVASLGAIGLILVYGHVSGRPERGLLAALGLVSLAISWLTVHMIFTLRYARVYYRDTPGGVDFNQSEPPCYRDFAYLALTLGMTYQVSDTSLQSTEMRSTALRHALLSYVFGAVILAAAINLVVGLGNAIG
jgi:uncharacterized membrane protein